MIAVLLVLCVGAAACAPVEIRNVESADADPVPAPDRIVVENFIVEPGAVHPDRGLLARGTDDLNDASPSTAAHGEARTIVRTLAKHIVSELRWLGWTADRAAQRSAEAGDLQIAGTFVEVHEGDSTERLLIGFGLGRSKVATHVRVFSVAHEQPVLLQEFDVAGAGGHAPGLVTSVPVTPATPFELADDAVSAAADIGDEAIDPEVEADVRRVARGIAAQLSALFLRRRWMPAGTMRSSAASGP